MNSAAAIRAALLALPLAGLGWTWLSTDQASRQGVEWEVPVQGYDPRDLLQGHYVQFQYEWPAKDAPTFGPGFAYEALCLEGMAPRLDRARARRGDEDCPALVRAGEAESGRLYVSQAEAARLQQQLWDRKQQGFIRIRLRPDGHITPLRLTFRPRVPQPPPPQTR